LLDADPDDDVIELLGKNDVRSAIHRLMQRYGVAVYRYCRVALRDPVLADDVHQQVFIEAFRDLPSFAGRSTVRIWLFSITRHRVLDAAKKRRRMPDCIEDTMVGEVPDLRPLAPEAIDDDRLGRALIASVADLDERTRAAILLRYQQGFTFEQMGAICGEKPGTLLARVGRALPLLRARIESRLSLPIRSVQRTDARGRSRRPQYA
jgi:RNA polymerase sigma-70 factor (ECF subfamily)